MATAAIILGLPALLLVKGFFSGAEIALVNVDRVRLSHLAREGHRGAKLALRLLKRPELLLSTTLIGTNIATVTLVTVGTGAAMQLAGPGADAYAVFLLAPLLLVLGEIVPKSIYQQNADKIAPAIIYPLWSISLLLAPLTFAFSGVARLVARVAGVRDAPPAVLVTKNMIRTVVGMADRAAGLESFDRKRIQRATRFDGQRIGEVLIPISEVPTVSTTDTMATVLAIVKDEGVYRIPVFESGAGDVRGVVTVSPWEVLEGIDPVESVAARMVDALYAVEGQLASELVPVLRERDDHMAVVVSDRGQPLGIVTLEAVLAGVSGPIDSGFHSAPRSSSDLTAVHGESEDELVLGGRVALAALGELLDIELPDTDAYTVGGLVNERLGRIARAGEQIRIEEWTIEVVEARPSEVRRVRVHRTPRRTARMNILR